MTYNSILFDKPLSELEIGSLEPPIYFTDLNLDQIVDAITLHKKEYNLRPFYYLPLQDKETILYRQEVMRELEKEDLYMRINDFAEKMVIMRRYLALIDKHGFKYHNEGWILESALIYCDAISSLSTDLNSASLSSEGMTSFREFLNQYVTSIPFTKLLEESKQLKADLGSFRYNILIKGDLIKVQKYEDATDYSVDVLATFEKFKQGEAKSYLSKLNVTKGMNHIEAQILNYVARLFPDIFATLDKFCNEHENFIDETIRRFDREIQFYVACIDFYSTIKEMGLKFCYPDITASNKEIFSKDSFDLALAKKLKFEQAKIVCNDFYLKDPERILVISGPNQGGKTTFARTFGQLHYLASLGCPVPGSSAKLFLFDKIFTHFEKEEDIRSLRGKLQDELVRIFAVLDLATPNSIVIINEIFNSTSLQDAIFLGTKIMDRLIALDLLCVCVTFIDEMSSLSEKSVSMVSTVVPDNPALRTYKLIRKPADGLAYAMSIAEKHHLTYDSIKDRIQP